MNDTLSISFASSLLIFSNSSFWHCHGNICHEFCVLCPKILDSVKCWSFSELRHVQQADASHHEATVDRHGQGTFLFITCARVTALGSDNNYFMLTLIKLPWYAIHCGYDDTERMSKTTLLAFKQSWEIPQTVTFVQPVYRFTCPDLHENTLKILSLL